MGRHIEKRSNRAHLIYGSTDVTALSIRFEWQPKTSILEAKLFDGVAADRGVEGWGLSFSLLRNKTSGPPIAQSPAEAPFCTTPSDGQAGSFAEFGTALIERSRSGDVDAYEEYMYEGGLVGPRYDGIILANYLRDSAGASVSISTATTSTPVQLGTVAATQNLALWVALVSFTGTNITIGVESDVSGGFSGTETQRASFGPFTTVDAEIATVGGAITPDDYYRLNITGTFTFAQLMAGAAIKRI